MPHLDARTLAQHALQLGLVTEEQVQEAFGDPESSTSDPEPLLRVLERKGYLTPWQSQKLLKGDKDGYFLGGYRLLYRIAAGSFGRVFRAFDPQSGNIVAIKVLRRRWSDQRRTIDLFEREGKMGLRLGHPNIVSVLAVDLDPATRQYYIVMEFVEGTNLRDFLVIRKKLEPAEALRLLEDAVQGLAYAYARGVTHRDIKPSNLLISTTGAVKLVDFGLADFCQEEESREDDSKVYRTVDYAGLEKATGVPQGDVRSDIYFLGCVLYEMLTGKSALVLTPDKRLRMQKERFHNAPRLDEHDGSSPIVVHLVEKMMALNPRHRYQTPSQLLEAVRAARRELEGGPTPEKGPAVRSERSIFIVEKHHKLQDTFRHTFKKLGYRVFLSAQGGNAVDRYRLQPYDVLLVDAGTSGLDSLETFRQIVTEAGRKNRSLTGILILGKDQADWTKMAPTSPSVAVLVRPVNLGQVVARLNALAGPQA